MGTVEMFLHSRNHFDLQKILMRPSIALVCPLIRLILTRTPL